MVFWMCFHADMAKSCAEFCECFLLPKMEFTFWNKNHYYPEHQMAEKLQYNIISNIFSPWKLCWLLFGITTCNNCKKCNPFSVFGIFEDIGIFRMCIKRTYFYPNQRNGLNTMNFRSCVLVDFIHIHSEEDFHISRRGIAILVPPVM